MKNQSGRSMLEIISVLAIVGVLSVGGLYIYRVAMNKHKVDEILASIHLKTVAIADAMQNKSFESATQMNTFLQGFATNVGTYQINFEVPQDVAFDGKMYTTKITTQSGKPLKGGLCHQLMKSMIEQKIITDIGVTVEEDEDGDGISKTVSLRLNGLAINLDAACGDDVI